MTKEKNTVSGKFEEVLNVLKVAKAKPELITFIEARKEMHEKRNARKSTSLTKTQKENLVLIEKINEFFFTEADPEIAYTSQEVSKAIEGMEDFTPQKMTALIKKANVERVEKATNEPKKVGYKAK